MDINSYQYMAMRTALVGHQQDALQLCALGLTGEAGEFADMVKKHVYHAHELDKDKLVKELGDVLWYVALSAKNLGIPLEDVARRNIVKLQERYPDGFESARSINRSEDDE